MQVTVTIDLPDYEVTATGWYIERHNDEGMYWERTDSEIDRVMNEDSQDEPRSIFPIIMDMYWEEITDALDAKAAEDTEGEEPEYDRIEDTY